MLECKAHRRLTVFMASESTVANQFHADDAHAISLHLLNVLHHFRNVAWLLSSGMGPSMRVPL